MITMKSTVPPDHSHSWSSAVSSATDSLTEARRHGIGLEPALGRALELNQFELHYQPQVRVATGEIVGVEALIRWRVPGVGLLLPGQFIAEAEKSGLIVPIAEWVLRTACGHNRAWQQRGLGPLRVSINLSALQFRQPRLVEMVTDVLDETGLDAKYLDLEVSESLVLGSVDGMLARFMSLKALGIAISIDDCSGYCEAGPFMHFPLSQLKIDRSFIARLPDGRRESAIARSIVNLGRSIGARVVAVGVETTAQLHFLRSIWCEYAQGNIFSEPLPASVFEEWMRDPHRGHCLGGDRPGLAEGLAA